MNRKPTLFPAKPEAAGVQARTGTDGLVEDLITARRDLLSARHPAYHRLVGTLLTLVSGQDADRTLLAGFERAWRTRSFPSFFERPLLILAALRADALQEGTSHPLFPALGARMPEPSVVTRESVAASLERDRLGVWSSMTTRRVQTNDTSRAIAWLWPAFLAGCDRAERPLVLADVGTGAGLNLIADQLPAIWSEAGNRKPIPCATRLHAVARMGFDLRPMNVQSDDDVQWMRACIWPGERERLDRFEAGILAMRAAAKRPSAPSVERLTASLVPGRLANLAPPAHTLILAYQTLVRGYLEPSEAETYRTGMLDLVSHKDAGSVLWVELELDDTRRRLPALLLAHVRAGDTVKSVRLGRMSQHPSEVEVDESGVAELRRHLGVR